MNPYNMWMSQASINSQSWLTQTKLVYRRWPAQHAALCQSIAALVCDRHSHHKVCADDEQGREQASRQARQGTDRLLRQTATSLCSATDNTAEWLTLKQIGPWPYLCYWHKIWDQIRSRISDKTLVITTTRVRYCKGAAQTSDLILCSNSIFYMPQESL